jgi:hypothetical protein
MTHTETIDHRTVAQAVRVGAVRGAHIVGQPGGWGVVFHYGQATPVLAAKRGEVRTFARLETLVGYLKELGIAQFEVDATGYDPDKTSRPRMRADAAERLRHAHAAAAHDKWFRAEVEKALQEADDPNTEWVPHAAVKADMAKQRAALLKRIKGSGK